MGKLGMEKRIQDEARYIIAELKKQDDRPFDMERMATNAVSNIISVIALGKRYEYDDDGFQHAIETVDELNETFQTGFLLKCVPILQKLPTLSRDRVSHTQQSSFLALVDYLENSQFTSPVTLPKRQGYDRHRPPFLEKS